MLAETNKFEMLITNENDLLGLPEGAKEAAKQFAESKDKDGWLITLDYPSYILWLRPTTPLRDLSAFKKAFKLFIKKKNFIKWTKFY